MRQEKPDVLFATLIVKLVGISTYFPIPVPLWPVYFCNSSNNMIVSLNRPAMITRRRRRRRRRRRK